jgi:hypothetical protein
MSRTSCKACGADVDMVTVKGTGERIALEVSPEAQAGADRYRIISANPLVAEKVPREAAGVFFPDHAFDCPAGNAGR